jgi:pyridoxal 5'-phosphate synthase pdxS subunit
LLRTKGEAGTGDVAEAVRHLRQLRSEIGRLRSAGKDELVRAAKELGAPLELVTEVATQGRLPVPNFAAGGIATPADAALCMALGAESVFVGSGIFLSSDAPRRARAIVSAVSSWQDGERLAEISTGLGTPMRSVAVSQLGERDRFSGRGG